MKIVTYGEVYAIRTGVNNDQGTVAIKIGNKVVRFKTYLAHEWTPGDRVLVEVSTITEEPLVTTQGSIDD